LGKETDIQIQEAQRTTIKSNKSKPTPRHIVIKFAKYSDKEKIFKAARPKKSVTYKRKPIKLEGDFQPKFCKPEGSGMIYSKC